MSELKLPLHRGELYYDFISGTHHAIIEIADSNNVGVAVCIVPDEDITDDTLHFIETNADLIITALNRDAALVAENSSLQGILGAIRLMVDDKSNLEYRLKRIDEMAKQALTPTDRSAEPEADDAPLPD